MNKALIALNILLLIVVGWLVIDRLSNGNNSAAGTADTEVTTTDTAKTKPVFVTPEMQDSGFVMENAPDRPARMAFINIDSVNERYAYIKDKIKEIQREQSSLENSLNRDAQSLGQEEMKLAQDPRQYNSDPNVVAAWERDAQSYMKKKEEFVTKQESRSNRLLKKQEELVLKMYDRTGSVISEYSESHNIDYVIGYSKTNPMLFHANPKFDITEIIIQKLNEEYAAEQAAPQE